MKPTKTSLFVLFAFAITSFLSPFTALAVASYSTVTIDSLVLSRCGTQMAYTSGTATYGSGPQYLSVKIDGSSVINTASQPALWVSGLTQVSSGNHTVTAVISSDESFTTILASDTEVFNVASCDDGDEEDCCPGIDPVTPEKPGKVLGATDEKKVVAPTTVAGAFASVFGKKPTTCEWNYWQSRYMKDKKSIAAILNTMKWYKAHGKTMPLSVFCEGAHKMRGQVFNISETEIEILVKIEPLTTMKFKLTKNTYMPKLVKRGSAVQVTFNKGSKNAVSVKNLSPNGKEAYFAGVDCMSCGI